MPARPQPVAPARPTPEPDSVRNRVALLVPTSGAQAAVGRSIANAALLALADVRNPRFRLTTYDTAAPGGAAGAARAAIGGGARVILGPLLAADVRAAAPIAAAAAVPVISFTNDAAVAGGGTYVLGFQPAQSVARVVAFARARGVGRFAALVPTGAYGSRASTAFLRGVQANGGAVTGIVPYARDRRAMVAAVRKLTGVDARATGVALRPDGTVATVAPAARGVAFGALLIPDTGAIAAAFGPLLAGVGAGPATVRLLGSELWASEPGLARAPSMRGAWFAAVPDRRFAQMATRYRARFGGQPSRLASLGYDAVLLVQSLGERWRIGEPFPSEALGAAAGFTGVDGVFRFNGAGVAERALEVRQVAPGGVAVVSPASAGF